MPDISYTLKTADIVANLFHLSFFLIANGLFAYALLTRLHLVYKSRSVRGLAPLGQRLRSFLINVIFQKKLYQSFLRGVMHAFIFYGFLSYIVHNTSQMVAGNAWLVFRYLGIDPYTFALTDYIWLGFDLSNSEATLIILAALAALAITMIAMNNVKLSKNLHWRKSPMMQWFFIGLMAIELGTVFVIIMGNGTAFNEFLVQHLSLLVLLGLGFFAYRRWIQRAKGLDVPSGQSALVLSFISALMISYLVHAAAQVHVTAGTAAHHPTWISSSILFLLEKSRIIYNDFSGEMLRNFAWWVHISTVLTFLSYIAFSKHSHLLFAPLNFFFVEKRPVGQMSHIDFEDEENTIWGTGNVSELSWASMLDGLSCIECGRCTVECPANQTGKPLDPKKIMVDIKHAMIDYKEDLQKSSLTEPAATPLIGTPYITEEEIWGCTSCNACVDACPVGNNQLDAILEMRRNLVLVESKFPPELQTAFQNMENQSNPWGMGAHSRADWCEDLGVKKMSETSDVDVLYWVGCAGAFDERNKKIARSFVNILNEADVNFAILGTEEKCTGDSARRGGNEYLYQMLAQENVDTLNNYNVKKIVTACPHCLHTLKNEYPQLNGNYEVQHHSDFIDDLMQQKKIQIDEEATKEVQHRRAVYHDSCYLGRYNEVFDEPRKLVQKALGQDIAEAEDHHRTSLCCGAGGAQMWMEETHEKVNLKRTQQLIDTGSDTIATACPFCITMITDGVKAKSLADDVQVLDVAEIVAATIKKQKNTAEDSTMKILREKGFAKLNA